MVNPNHSIAILSSVSISVLKKHESQHFQILGALFTHIRALKIVAHCAEDVFNVQLPLCTAGGCFINQYGAGIQSKIPLLQCSYATIKHVMCSTHACFSMISCPDHFGKETSQCRHWLTPPHPHPHLHTCMRSCRVPRMQHVTCSS